MEKKPAKGHRNSDYKVERHYLNQQGAAEYLGCNVRHIRRLIRLGQIPEHDFGPTMKRYTRADLDAYAAAHRKQRERQKELRQRMGAATWDELVGT